MVPICCHAGYSFGAFIGMQLLMRRPEISGWVSVGAQVAPHHLTHRAAFAHGVIDGRTAQEFEPNGKAAQEIEQL